MPASVVLRRARVETSLVKVETEITWTESAQGVFNHGLLERGLGLVNFFSLLLLLIALHQQLHAGLGRGEELRRYGEE